MKRLHKSFFCGFCFVYIVNAIPQQPEINDQYENTTQVEEIKQVEDITTTLAEIAKSKDLTIEDNEVLPKRIETKTEIQVEPESFIRRMCNILRKPLIAIISIPKVNSVLRNIGTCVVNGAMELITFYFPPPLIPLIAMAAGMIIPFEPVVLLREKMPVTSYRRAFRTALNSFMGTFDRYKLDDEDDDPYMTRRFNRRLNDSGEKN